MLPPTAEDQAIVARVAKRHTPAQMHTLFTMLGGDDQDFALLQGRERYAADCKRRYGQSPAWAAIAHMESLGGSLLRCVSC